MTEIEPSSPFLYPDRLYEGYVFDLDASYDRGFEYRKLRIAFDAIWVHKRARLVTTNPDPYRPMPGGSGEPDAAAIVGAIEACTGTNRSGEGIRRESQNLERGAGSPSTKLGAKNSPGAGGYFMARSELVDDERCGSW